MTMARVHLVDPAVTRWYHCVTRCVRRAFQLGEGPEDRKKWIECQLQALSQTQPGRGRRCAVPEASPHTSVSTRVEHVNAQGRASDLKAAEQGSNSSAGLEESLWLCPIEDRQNLDSSREGMLEGLSLGSYLILVDYTGRVFRDGKAAISAEVTGILDRLQSGAERWRARLEKLRGGRLLGRFFAASRERLREVAARRGVHHLANLAGCPAR